MSAQLAMNMSLAESALVIKKIDGVDPRWDALIDQSPDASFFHRLAWRDVIQSAFGHATHYLYAERSGRIVAVLPLAEIKSALFGHALISLPFCVCGGAIGEAEACRQLELSAAALSESLGVDYLELRSRTITQETWPCKSDLYVNFRKAMDADPAVNLQAIPRKQRAMIRKGEQAGLIAVEENHIDNFYQAYSASVRNLGTPVFSKRYFELLKNTFGNACRILTVKHDEQVISSVMSFYFRDEVLPYYGGGNDAARDLKANDFMYWALMQQSCLEGVRWFDYGRSKRDSGSYRFKKHWGFDEEPLYYQYHLVNAKAVPNISPTNPKYALFINLWRRLPLSVSQVLGPLIAKNLG